MKQTIDLKRDPEETPPLTPWSRSWWQGPLSESSTQTSAQTYTREIHEETASRILSVRPTISTTSPYIVTNWGENSSTIRATVRLMR